MAETGQREPVWLADRLVLVAYREQLARHSVLGGRVDRIRLSAALALPKTFLAFAGRSVRLVELAAHYSAAVLRLKPFSQANERMAYLLSTLFMGLNGLFLPTAAHEKFKMFAAMASKLLPLSSYIEWLDLQWLATQHPQATVMRVRTRAGQVVGVSLLAKIPPPAAAARPPELATKPA